MPTIDTLTTPLDFKLYELEKAAARYESHAQALRAVITRYRLNGLPYDPTTQL